MILLRQLLIINSIHNKMKTILTLLTVCVTSWLSAQSLVSITPSTGVVGTTVSVTIIGSGTSFTNTTRFGLNNGGNVIQLTNVVAKSGTEVTANVVIPSSASAGEYNLSAIVGIGVPLQLAKAFTITGGSGRVAAIKTLTPNEGGQGEFMQITISGTNTAFTQSSNTTVTLTKIGSTPIVSGGSFAQNDSDLVCFLEIPKDAALGNYTAIVNTTNNGILTKTAAFKVVPSRFGTIKSVTPNSSVKEVTLNITISGSGTKFKQASQLDVYFDHQTSFYGLPINSMNAVNDTTLIVNLSIPKQATSGIYDLGIGLDMGYIDLTAAFTVIGNPADDPALKAISPNYGNPGQTLDIIMSGNKTSFKQATDLTAAIFNQTTFIEATNIVVNNDSLLVATFQIPNNFAIDVYDVGVASGIDGTLMLEQAFSIVATSVKEFGQFVKNLFISPNPVQNTLNFETQSTINNVVVVDITGKQVSIPLTDIEQNTNKNNAYSIDLGKFDIRQGIYFLKVETDQGIQYQKFIAQ